MLDQPEVPIAIASPATIHRRNRIGKIQSDPKLSAKQKGHLMQSIMSEKYRQMVNEASESRCTDIGNPHNVPKSTRPDGLFGCEHYTRNCLIKAACCEKFFHCRMCHDANSNHKIDRRKTKEMFCLKCGTTQPCAKSCRQCGEIMGKYYCEVCKLWDNDKEKHIYHCDKCGLCRVGEGLGIDFYHCDKCNVCMSIKLKDNHPCIERNLESDCPICGEYMFTSTRNICFMRCGHCMHRDCYKKHVVHSYQCPICSKSLWDMPKYFAYLDRLIGERPMPEEYANSLASIFCNDCEEKSTCSYHFIGHKCESCKSYNTRTLDVFTARDQAEVTYYRELGNQLRQTPSIPDPELADDAEDSNVERGALTAALSMNSIYSSCGSLSNLGSDLGSTQHLSGSTQQLTTSEADQQ